MHCLENDVEELMTYFGLGLLAGALCGAAAGLALTDD